MKIEKPGIFRGVDSADYFRDPCIEPSFTQSLAKVLIDQSPLHAFQAHPRLAVPTGDEDDGEKYEKAKAIGNAAHSLMMGRGKSMAIIDHPNFMTKLAKAERDEAFDAGREPILAKHFDTASKMVVAARQQLSQIPYCQDAFMTGHGDGEVVIANCEDGHWLRSMIDWITPDLAEVWDLKTSGMSASPYATGRLMAAAGWHVQCAMHERILDELDPENAGRRKYRYVCQENEPPFALTVNEIGEAALTIGRKQIDFAFKTWRYCMASGIWPAYPLRIIRPELPPWAENAWMDREIKEYEAEQAAGPRTDFNPRNLMAG
jgi:hypothetical protein